MSTAMWVAWGAMAGFVGVYGWVWEKAGARWRAWMEWGLVMLVAGVSLASVATHEPWRDELHAWVQAKEMGLGALWMEMACEGHFLPWYLLLWPLAHSGAPVWSMGAVSWGLNAVAVGWLARRSPLTGWEKAAAGVSCLFLYVNPVISRCYVLVPLALWGVASLWERRDERPVAFGLWVALLANTHLYMEGAAVTLFMVFAWKNVLGRKDGRGWRDCRWQWAGLGVMAAGGALALAQVLPSLWKSAVPPGYGGAFWEDSTWFFRTCVSRWGMVALLAGLAGVGGVAWRKDRGAFGVYVGALAYMWGFSVFLYHAGITNRSLLWWPVVLFAAWVAAGKGGGACWRVVAVVAAGVSIARPDMTWADWRLEYDPLPGACRWIAERYGEDVEVWINGDDYATEPAAVYLVNVKDWRTGEKARPTNWSAEAAKHVVPPFRACREAVFRTFPEQASFLALGSCWEFSGLEEGDSMLPGVEVERTWMPTLNGSSVGLVLMRVNRWGGEWMSTAMLCYQKGDRERAVAAWTRAAEEDDGHWAAMNNLAWVLLEEGRVAEAREWIDRAMADAAAKENPGVRDTEAAVRRAESKLSMQDAPMNDTMGKGE